MTEATMLQLVDMLIWPVVIAIIVVALREPIGECLQAIFAWVFGWLS